MAGGRKSDFQTTEVFDWASEPKDERPSEFHSTGFSTASGYYHSLDDPGRAADRGGSKRRPLALIAALLAAIGLGGVGVYFLAQFLRR